MHLLNIARGLIARGLIALAALALCPLQQAFVTPARAAQRTGLTVPPGTASLPVLVWSNTANGGLAGWTAAGALPLGALNGGLGGAAFDGAGGLSLAPSATAGNGLIVNLPASSAGSGLILKSNGATLWSTDNTGRITVGPGQVFSIRNSTGSDILQVGASSLLIPLGFLNLPGGGAQIQGGGGGYAGGIFTNGFASTIPLNNTVATIGKASVTSVNMTLQEQSGQTADAEQLLTSTGTLLKHTTAEGKTYAQGFGVRSGTTDTDGYTGAIPPGNYIYSHSGLVTGYGTGASTGLIAGSY